MKKIFFLIMIFWFSSCSLCVNKQEITETGAIKTILTGETQKEKESVSVEVLEDVQKDFFKIMDEVIDDEKNNK